METIVQTDYVIEKDTPEYALLEAIAEDNYYKETEIEDPFSMDLILGPINELINKDRFVSIAEVAKTIPIKTVLSFIEKNSHKCLFLNQNRMIKMFVLLNQMIYIRDDIKLEDFEPLLNKILKMTTRSGLIEKKLNMVKLKVLEDILIPFGIKGRLDFKNPFALLSQALPYIVEYLPYSEYKIEDIFEKVHSSLPKIYAPKTIEQLTFEERKIEDQKDEYDRLKRDELIAAQEAA